MLERRAISRLGEGWSTIPNRSPGRWIVPRGPKETAAAGLRIYHPGHHPWAARLGGRSLVRGGGCRSTATQDGPAPALRPREARTAYPEAGHAGRGQGES